MFGILKSKEVKSVDLSQVATKMANLYWDVENKGNHLVVHGKYRFNRRDFKELVVKFLGDNVFFHDVRGNLISNVKKEDMYVELKEIMNVVS